MTPNERLDQLEPLLADGLQKIDRLIEGQGKILDLATSTEQRVGRLEQQFGRVEQQVGKVEQRVGKVEQKLDTVAEALAKLTVSTQRQHQELTVATQRQYEELKDGQESIMQYLREKLP